MPINRLIVIGFILVLIGAVLPFLIVLRFVPSTFFLNFLAYGASIVGIFLGVIGVANYVGDMRRKNRDEWGDY
ncbi:MAG: hypothetical protein R3300_10565 [Candidatus Promineifilaceae bacterium]|nr:hypothetical protein [Candidatus Promineifilaceae bacterium]